MNSVAAMRAQHIGGHVFRVVTFAKMGNGPYEVLEVSQKETGVGGRRKPIDPVTYFPHDGDQAHPDFCPFLWGYSGAGPAKSTTGITDSGGYRDHEA